MQKKRVIIITVLILLILLIVGKIYQRANHKEYIDYEKYCKKTYKENQKLSNCIIQQKAAIKMIKDEEDITPTSEKGICKKVLKDRLPTYIYQCINYMNQYYKTKLKEIKYIEENINCNLPEKEYCNELQKKLHKMLQIGWKEIDLYSLSLCDLSQEISIYSCYQGLKEKIQVDLVNSQKECKVEDKKELEQCKSEQESLKELIEVAKDTTGDFLTSCSSFKERTINFTQYLQCVKISKELLSHPIYNQHYEVLIEKEIEEQCDISDKQKKDTCFNLQYGSFKKLKEEWSILSLKAKRMCNKEDNYYTLSLCIRYHIAKSIFGIYGENYIPEIDTKSSCKSEDKEVEANCLAEEAQANVYTQEQWSNLNIDSKAKCLANITVFNIGSYKELASCVYTEANK